MKTLNLRETKARLSKVIDDLEKTGEFVTVTRHGKPAAVLVPVEAAERLKNEQKPNFGEFLMSFPGPLEIERKTGDFREIDL